MKTSGAKIAIIVIVVIAIGALVAVLLHNNKNNSSYSSTSSSGSSNSSSSNTSSSNTTATDAIMMQGFSFSPGSITVKVGTKVTWTNKDSVSHTVTADNASSDAPNSQLIPQNQSYSFTFNKAGTYTYHCTPHPYMHGTVIVTQ